MNYYHIKSIFSSNKTSLRIQNQTPSFFIADRGGRPYIEPTFEKVVFPVEKPTILLVSAVGATGKTALAEKLSEDTNLPILDLGKHKPVGDSTLTGLLPHAFEVKDIGTLFEGLASGSYGVIIDGIDEGRSKTTEKGFEAFLDDVLRLCKTSTTTTFVMLGRTQTLEDCWLYLSEKGIRTGLITITPFTVDSARQYIDAFTKARMSAYASQYATARDAILKKLSKAFGGGGDAIEDQFLSFIGYPPVLDVIVALLKDEKDYHKLQEDIDHPTGNDIEISLLYRIATRILEREKNDKIIPNIVRPLLQNAPLESQRSTENAVFGTEEQCIRLIGYCLGKSVQLSVIGEPLLDEKYEKGLASVFHDHPFLDGHCFRNAVFESLAVAALFASQKADHKSLLDEYMSSRRHSYHVIYMLDMILADHRFAASNLALLLSAAMEFRSVHASVEFNIEGPEWDGLQKNSASGVLNVGIEIRLGETESPSQSFAFSADITSDTRLSVGPRLAGAFISVPCEVRLGGNQEIELTAPIELEAASIMLDARALILRPAGQQKQAQSHIILESERLTSTLETITTNKVPLTIGVADMANVSYPVIQYAVRTLPPATNDPLLLQKYFRLRRILVHFRSHSKGGLAKLRDKIEHERVLKNEIGEDILRRLVSDKILYLDGNKYFLDPVELNRHLDVSYEDLRKGQMPERLVAYLNAVG